MISLTHDTMHHSMLTKQDHFTWRTHEPLSLVLKAFLRLIESKFLDCPTDRVTLTLQGGSYVVVTVDALLESYCTRIKQSMLEVIKEVYRIFDAYTETYKVFRKASSCTRGRINGRMSCRANIVRRRSNSYEEEDLRHDAGHANE